MKLYVIRHGRTPWNEKGLMQGLVNIKLSETGKKEAKDIREKLKDISFDICISSPLKRTLETANIVINGKCKIITDELLIERNLGEFEGKKYFVPGDIEEYLRGQYGSDFMTLPPIEKRMTHEPIKVQF